MVQDRQAVLIIGGGVSGIAAALRFCEAGNSDIDLVERDGRLGGLYRSHEIDGLSFDIGSFLFTEQSPLLGAFPEVREHFVATKSHPAKCIDDGRILKYPIDLEQEIASLGTLTKIRVLLDIVRYRLRIRSFPHTEAFIQYFLGDILYRHTFLDTYVRRVFNVSADQVDVEFAEERLSYLKNQASIGRILSWAAKRRRQQPSYRRGARTLVRGRVSFDTIFADLERSLGTRGIAVHKNHVIERITKRPDGCFEVQGNGKCSLYHQVVATCPIEEMHQLAFGQAPRVRTLKLLSVFLVAERRAETEADILFNFQNSGRWKRVTLRSRQVCDPVEHMTAEATYLDDEEIDAAAEAEAIRRELSAIAPFCGAGLKVVGTAITTAAYPFPVIEQIRQVAQMRAMLADWGVTVLGKQGAHRHIPTSAKAMDAAGRAVDRLIGSRPGR